MFVESVFGSKEKILIPEWFSEVGIYRRIILIFQRTCLECLSRSIALSDECGLPHFLATRIWSSLVVSNCLCPPRMNTNSVILISNHSIEVSNMELRRYAIPTWSVWEGITESCGINEYTHWILPYCKKLRHNNINTNSCGLGLEWFAESHPVSCRIVWVCARIECKVTRSITIFAVHEDSCQLPPELNRMSKWWDSCTTKPQHSIPVRQKCSVTGTNLRNCSSMSHEIDTHPLCKCTRKLLPLLQLLKVVVVVDDGDIGNWFPWVGLLLYRAELDGFAHLGWEFLCWIVIEVDRFEAATLPSPSLLILYRRTCICMWCLSSHFVGSESIIEFGRVLCGARSVLI